MTAPISILTLLLCVSLPASAQDLSFVNITSAAGIFHEHELSTEIVPVEQRVSAGLAVGDYDNDGYLDFYVEVGDVSQNKLYRNKGDGTFEELASSVGLDLQGYLGGGACFVDYDNDGWVDLLQGGLGGTPMQIFRNQGSGRFVNVTEESGIDCDINTCSIAAGDYNKDGLLDLFLTHWLVDFDRNHIWRNNGDGTFTNVDEDLSFSNPWGDIDYSFSGTFTDLDKDGFQDLVVSSDFGTSQIWRNQSGESFQYQEDLLLTDENGMGSAIGDYNNDGFLDWFVSSIYDYDGVTEGNWGATGNRLYQNSGNGEFEDVTDEANVRNGSWGWGSSFADFNNDGHLDLVQTNGWPRGSDQFYFDTTRLFLADGNGSFQESAEVTGLLDTAQGRGISTLDFDRDGDLDILITNYLGGPSLWRNDNNGPNNYLALNFTGAGGGIVGAKIEAFADGLYQFRELRCGTNYNSQNPLEVHLGLGTLSRLDSLIIYWPDGTEQILNNVLANQLLTIKRLKYQEIVEDFSIYPNPFDNVLYFQGELDIRRQKRAYVQVYDLLGELVFEMSDQQVDLNGNWLALWNVDQDLPAGTYCVILFYDDSWQGAYKIIKTSLN